MSIMARAEVPADLVKLADVVKQHRPSRSWWDKEIAQGRITAYKVPGDRGLYLSQSAVDELLQPRPHERREREEDAL
jgi:hypothetical protein